MATDRTSRAATSSDQAGSVVCIGHSHATAVAQAALARGRDIDPILFWSEAGAVDSDGALRPDLADRVRRAHKVIAAVGGSSAVVVGLVEHQRPFDFVLPSEPELPLDPTRELLPADAVRAALAAEEAKYTPLLEQVKVLSSGVVIQIEAPPPVEDSAFISGFVPWSLWPDQPQAVAPAALRYKLWRLSSEVIAATCARLDVIYQPAPSASLDRAGFMAPGLSSDGIHGDSSYGQLVWDVLGL
jgi:hypothetical protein